MTRRIRLGWIIAALFLIAAPVGGQFPGQNIPPTRVPLQSDEPPLADKKSASDLPDKDKKSLIGSAPATRGIVTPTAPTVPVSLDPPTPVVAIHMSAPSSISAGADLEYKITVENKSQAEAHHVRVTFPKPPGAQVLPFEPKLPGMVETTTSIMWDLGTLKPGESRKDIRIVLRPTKEGLDSFEATARVQFEHGQKVRTVLHRPQIKITKVANRHALENEPIACKLVVENTGAVEVNGIVIQEAFDSGLLLPGKDATKPMMYEQRIDSLAPKQTKEFFYTISAARPGSLGSKIHATAERGVSVNEPWNITVGPSPLTVKLTGPKQVYLNYPAQYDIVVHYDARAPLENVVVAFGLQKGMKIVRSTPGSKSFENRLQWTIPKLTAKETKFSVWAQASTPGIIPTFTEVLWHGPRQHDEATTDFIGAAALHLDIRESNDPVRVGEKVRYTLTVTNRGTAAAKDVKLVANYGLTYFTLDTDGSDGMAAKMREGVHEIGPLTIPPKGTVTKTITLKAIHSGKTTLHVEMESPEHLPAGNVTREEPTTITD